MFSLIFLEKEEGKRIDRNYDERESIGCPPAGPFLGINPETRASALTGKSNQGSLGSQLDVQSLATPAGLGLDFLCSKALDYFLRH